MEMILPHLRPTDVVIDIGCGNGRLAAAISPHVKKVCGVDYSQELVEDARARNPDVFFVSKDVNNFDTWTRLPLFEKVVSNVAIRKDGCKLEQILPAIGKVARRPTQCFFRIQGERDLPGWLVTPPLYNEEEIRYHFGDDWNLEITEEIYQQKFTDEAYFRTFLERIGITVQEISFSKVKSWPLRVQRHYYCVSAVR